MKAAAPFRRRRSNRQLLALGTFLAAIVVAQSAAATTQFFLARDSQAATSDLTGIVDLTINPGFDDGRVTITVDGQKIAEGLRSPYRVSVDFGPSPVEHKITVVALTADKRRVQWHTT
ncbi:MAG: hypothetical protein ACXVJO_14090, partial [Thermoanaerobaculia bacterium]